MESTMRLTSRHAVSAAAWVAACELKLPLPVDPVLVVPPGGQQEPVLPALGVVEPPLPPPPAPPPPDTCAPIWSIFAWSLWSAFEDPNKWAVPGYSVT